MLHHKKTITENGLVSNIWVIVPKRKVAPIAKPTPKPLSIVAPVPAVAKVSSFSFRFPTWETYAKEHDLPVSTSDKKILQKINAYHATLARVQRELKRCKVQSTIDVINGRTYYTNI